MWKKILKASVLILCIGCAVLWSWFSDDWFSSKNKSVKRCDKCNILIIDIDTLRADSLKCFGGKRDSAPNICKFAEKSVLFSDNYSPSFWTFTSIISTNTSLYPSFHQMRNSYINVLVSDKATLAETLQKQGYRTIYIGNMNNSASLNVRNGGLRGFDIITQEPIEKVIDNQKNSDKPWFIYYYNQALHMPYLLPPGEKPIEELKKPENFPVSKLEFDKKLNTYLKKNYKKIFTQKAIDKYGSEILSPIKEGDLKTANIFYSLYDTQFWGWEGEYFIDGWKAIQNTYLESIDINNPEDLAYMRLMYDTIINGVDKRLQTLFEKLNTKPWSENTISMLMSDHGESFGERGRFSHDSGYHSVLYSTPLILHAPKLATDTVYQPTSNIDIFPTVLDMAKLDTPNGLQGISLAPYIEDKKNNNDKRPFVVAESSEGKILLNKKWLYYLPDSAKDLNDSILFNRINDPEQKNNVAKDNLNLVRKLYSQAWLIRSYDLMLYNEQQTFDKNIFNIDEQKQERMKIEGYF